MDRERIDDHAAPDAVPEMFRKKEPSSARTPPASTYDLRSAGDEDDLCIACRSDLLGGCYPIDALAEVYIHENHVRSQ